MFKVVALVFCVFAVAVVVSYPTGAPLEACVTLEPQHGFAPQTGPSPYVLTAANNGDGTYQATISKIDAASADFKGILIQARIDTATDPVGAFTVTDTNFHNLDCLAPGVSVTHSSNITKTSASFVWTPPAGGVAGVSFRGTVVQQFDTIWTGHHSENLDTLP